MSGREIKAAMAKLCWLGGGVGSPRSSGVKGPEDAKWILSRSNSQLLLAPAAMSLVLDGLGPRPRLLFM